MSLGDVLCIQQAGVKIATGGGISLLITICAAVTSTYALTTKVPVRVLGVVFNLRIAFAAFVHFGWLGTVRVFVAFMCVARTSKLANKYVNADL